MGEGLRKHYHQHYLYNIQTYYDDEKGCMVKKATFRCMICGHEFHERYEFKPPPRLDKANKKLEKHKKKYGNRK